MGLYLHLDKSQRPAPYLRGPSFQPECTPAWLVPPWKYKKNFSYWGLDMLFRLIVLFLFPPALFCGAKKEPSKEQFLRERISNSPISYANYFPSGSVQMHPTSECRLRFIESLEYGCSLCQKNTKPRLVFFFRSPENGLSQVCCECSGLFLVSIDFPNVPFILPLAETMEISSILLSSMLRSSVYLRESDRALLFGCLPIGLVELSMLRMNLFTDVAVYTHKQQLPDRVRKAFLRRLENSSDIGAFKERLARTDNANLFKDIFEFANLEALTQSIMPIELSVTCRWGGYFGPGDYADFYRKATHTVKGSVFQRLKEFKYLLETIYSLRQFYLEADEWCDFYLEICKVLLPAFECGGRLKGLLKDVYACCVNEKKFAAAVEQQELLPLLIFSVGLRSKIVTEAILEMDQSRGQVLSKLLLMPGRLFYWSSPSDLLRHFESVTSVAKVAIEYSLIGSEHRRRRLALILHLYSYGVDVLKCVPVTALASNDSFIHLFMLHLRQSGGEKIVCSMDDSCIAGESHLLGSVGDPTKEIFSCCSGDGLAHFFTPGCFSESSGGALFKRCPLCRRGLTLVD